MQHDNETETQQVQGKQLLWEKMDDYYWQSGHYTICHAHSVLCPLTLYNGGERISGHENFKQALDAGDQYEAQQKKDDSHD